MNRKLTLKSLRRVPFGANLAKSEAKAGMPGEGFRSIDKWNILEHQKSSIEVHFNGELSVRKIHVCNTGKLIFFLLLFISQLVQDHNCDFWFWVVCTVDFSHLFTTIVRFIAFGQRFFCANSVNM